jgi:cytoskeletal protein CcmA (bactofilin family)
MFGKSKEKSAVSPQTRTSSAGAEAGISIIGPGMRIVGDLTTEGTVRIEGRIEGTIRASKSVVLGKDGEVVGDIITQDAIIGGRINGTLTAENRLELQSTSRIDGRIRARAQHIQLDEGAHFNGQIEMIEPEQAVRAIPAETGADAGKKAKTG